MISEKDLKLTINNLWKEIKNIKLEQNNAVYSVGLRCCQVIALMKVLGRENIFEKEDIEHKIEYSKADAEKILSKLSEMKTKQKV